MLLIRQLSTELEDTSPRPETLSPIATSLPRRLAPRHLSCIHSYSSGLNLRIVF